MAFKIEWTDEARADIRALDRVAAMRIFDGLHRYALTGEDDVKTLQGKHAGKLRRSATVDAIPLGRSFLTEEQSE